IRSATARGGSSRIRCPFRTAALRLVRLPVGAAAGWCGCRLVPLPVGLVPVVRPGGALVSALAGHAGKASMPLGRGRPWPLTVPRARIRAHLRDLWRASCGGAAGCRERRRRWDFVGGARAEDRALAAALSVRAYSDQLTSGDAAQEAGGGQDPIERDPCETAVLARDMLRARPFAPFDRLDDRAMLLLSDRERALRRIEHRRGEDHGIRRSERQRARLLEHALQHRALAHLDEGGVERLVVLHIGFERGHG